MTVTGTGRATSAGVYDYVLQGQDNFPPDRELAARLLAIAPELGRLAKANREYLKAAVLLAAGQLDVRQVVDLGCGHPAKGGVLESALKAGDDVRCLCVDTDEDIADPRYGYQAVLDEQGITRAAVAQADLCCPDEVTGHPAAGVIDFGKPVCVVAGLVLHYWPAEEAAGIVAAWADWLQPGSVVAVTVTAVPGRARYAAMRDAWQAGTGGDFCDYHQPGTVAGLFGELKVLNPGPGPLCGLRDAEDERAYLAGGIAVKDR